MRGFGEADRRRREPSRGAAGAEGAGVWGGVSRSPVCGNFLGRGHQKFFPIFGLQVATFGALWGLFLRFSGLFWTQTAAA